jgi:mRNA-degrading endonuclease RelE of RelBE toxin-antitoxin system
VTCDPNEVSWASSALRSLDRLPEKIAMACIEFVYSGLAQHPHQVGRQLRFDLVGRHSARRGDFRVIYEVDDDRDGVTVVAVDHRSGVYRPR